MDVCGGSNPSHGEDGSTIWIVSQNTSCPLSFRRSGNAWASWSREVSGGGGLDAWETSKLLPRRNGCSWGAESKRPQPTLLGHHLYAHVFVIRKPTTAND
ncbi:BQ5605_C019g08828 [Microbotryum silenes-dioicae]|uniref:BQ5605_C019g08828 protein n=1 Tax=Microbotryum silenes-dioicae TaxID=796604 RepID=A0A2X0NTG9_9BASI|nr:BQ5605_C019g08828 [Microbotryum silenes-dioicae]